MSPNTALGFTLAGLALFCPDCEWRGVRPAQIFAVTAAFVALLALVGYAYGVSSFYLTYKAGMALHTAVSFLILCIGILFVRPDKGVMSFLASVQAGGFIARRLIPVAVVAPLLLGLLRQEGERAGFYSAESGIILFAVSNITILVAIIWLYAGRLNDVDAERLHQAEPLLRVNRALKTLSESNMALVTAGDEEELINTVCRNLVSLGEYRAAWAGFVDGENGTIRPAARAGHQGCCLNNNVIFGADTELSRCPAGLVAAVRGGKPFICRSLVDDPGFARWRERVLQRGCASFISMPLSHSGRLTGYLR
ncbi:MAG: GAF domain-containing protein [Deltaproteobacteria bacterium]|nr:GAF domain-containing protein [Deltaproteobacteria bacterium]